MNNLEQSLDEIIANSKETGRLSEFTRIFKLLTEKEALRSSFFLDGYVLYTENGPIDISLEELRGEDA